MAVAVAQPSPTSTPHNGATIRREFQSINLFRLLESIVIVAIMFSPYAIKWVQVSHPTLGDATALSYFAFAFVAWAYSSRKPEYYRTWIDISLIVDIVAVALAMFSIQRQFLSLALLLLVNVGAAATVLPRRLSFFYAALATIGVFSQCIAGNIINQDDREIVEVGICGLAYFVVTALCVFLGRRMLDTEALASQRGSDLVDLASINELIIRRMKTGVFVVDGGGVVRQRNEAAVALLGNPSHGQDDLISLAPELARRLYRWRTTHKADDTPIALSEGAGEVIPRFTSMSVHDEENVLIFLDDASMVSRRAEQISLASTGRLAASIAHEIRNPLAAITHASQLLAESSALPTMDQRLVEIIRNHAGRVNDIVENVLHLARRERSMPEHVDLVAWADRFVIEFAATTELGTNTLVCSPQAPRAATLVDPRQLHQVVWNLVQNALRYGHQLNEPSRVALVARSSGDRGLPTLDVVDRGPGIPPKVAERIFEPFYTTHELGTGLGLYLARELCVANLATLEYVSLAGGGACFRITFAAAQGMAA